MSKRPDLKKAIGQTKLLEIIDEAYDRAKNCPNCRALMEWWEQHGSALPQPGVTPDVPRQRRR